MSKQKLYFLNIDDTHCYPLEDRINDAKFEGLKKITLIEAIPANDDLDYIYCTHNGEVTERTECKKSICSYYKSTSGRGVCKHRGHLYSHGEEAVFNIY